MKTNKKVFTKNGTLFSPNLSGYLRSDAHQSQIIAGDADIDRKVELILVFLFFLFGACFNYCFHAETGIVPNLFLIFSAKTILAFS